MGTKSKKFDFLNNKGEKLSGRLDLPEGNPRAVALFAHCFTCSKNILATTRISKGLSEQGIAVFRFDFTGLGNSEGEFANTNFSSNIQDLECAYNALKAEFMAPEIIIGHSLGGAAILKLSTILEDVKAVVTIGAPSEVSHVSHLFKNDMEEINEKGQAEVDLAGRKFNIKKQFIDDLKEHNLLNDLAKVRKSFLIMHSPIDSTVSVDHAAKIYSSLKHPKSYISLDNMDHLVSNPDDAQYIANMINTWVNRYIDKRKEEDISFEGDILVSNRKDHKFTQDIYSQSHHLVADEPKSVKGDNMGMNPYELLLSGLGACTSMTMKMYADKKGFDLQDVRVELSHKKEHVEDCLTCEDKAQKLDVITKKIEITGNLTEEERQKILEIANKCPVNRTLLSEVIIKTEE